MSVSALCFLLLEVCRASCTDLILGTFVPRRCCRSLRGWREHFQHFVFFFFCSTHTNCSTFPTNAHSSHGVLLVPWFWACTCNHVAPLTPLCCIILTHCKHWTSTPSGSGYYLQGAVVSQCHVCSLTNTHTHTICSIYTQCSSKATPSFQVITSNTWALQTL